ncbi:MAG: hypothetical protein V3U71_09310 [Cocleimonas sp.]
MITYDELNTQNDKITELSNVLSVLIKDRSLCDSEICSQLFYNYMDKVNEHMQFIDSNFYQSLLTSSSTEANKLANNFMSGSHEIKRVMNNYAKKWCKKSTQELKIGGGLHNKFIEQTDEMFEMILDRIQDEMEKLYPMVRQISNG